MPTFIRQLTPQGLVSVAYIATSLSDAVQHEPQTGVYTVTNTFHHTQVLKFDAHLDRMEASAHLANIPLQLDRARLRMTLREMIIQSGFGDVRFRITIGADAPDIYIISLEPFAPPAPDHKAQGVTCATLLDSARQNPLVKSTEWMHQRADIQDHSAYETLLTDAHGALLEGTGSNFYAIKDGVLWTAEDGVLVGIARSTVLEIAPNIIPVRLEALNISDIPHITEAFITSSSRGIIPVVKIDDQPISIGGVGETTKRLMHAYDQWVMVHLEEL